MTAESDLMTNSNDTKPRRGRPRRVDRERIIEAARVLDPATLTMQQLALEIGVDRKTLHYHVENRQTLLRMVAADAFREAVAQHQFTPKDDWRHTLRSFATLTRAAVISAGAWASYVAFENERDLEAVRPAEAAVGSLIAAGLAETDAGRVIALLAELAFASARDHTVTGGGTHPQEPELEQALKTAPDGEFALIRRLVGAHSSSLGSDEQFAFDVTLIIHGVEKLLADNQQ